MHRGFQLTFSHDKAGQSHAALVPILAAVQLLHPVLPDLPHQGVKSIFHTLHANTRSGIFFPQAFEITHLSIPEPLNGSESHNSAAEQHPADPVVPKRRNQSHMDVPA